MKKRFLILAAAASCVLSACGNTAQQETHDTIGASDAAKTAERQKTRISLQSQFTPLFIEDAPTGGAHPIGGPAYLFVTRANAILAPLGAELSFHATGPVSHWDADHVAPPLAAFPDDFPTLHDAVAKGKKGAGVDMGIGLANMNGHPFGHLLVAGLPFGLEPDEFAAWLYAGGGLELQQEIYNAKFDGSVVVMPIGLTATQGGGWFSAPLIDPDTTDNISAEAAMVEICERPIIVRWPEPGSRVWGRACDNVGVETRFIGAKTRCADPNAPCPSQNNPITQNVKSLAFGGFIPGGLPHKLTALGHIDAYELNTAYTDVMMMKLASDQAGISNDNANLTPIIEAAPYLYAGNWHQPLSYIELLINRSLWNDLSQAQRTAIETAAQASVMQSLAVMLDVQDEGMDILEKNGAVILRWPDGLLDLLRQANDQYLDDEAARLSNLGDDSYARLLKAQREYLSARQTYFDFGDINQGKANIPTSPR